jgi:hypothetical protein
MNTDATRLGTLFGLCLALLALTACNTSCNPKPNASEGTTATFGDADSDGIPDAWESQGFEIQYPDGSKETLRSSPRHKDIYVFVAWMEDATHTHKPDPEAVNTVMSSFANSLVPNLDGSNGISLHILYAHQPVPEQAMLGTFDNQGNYNWQQFDAIKASVFPHLTGTDGPNLAQVMHFCLFAHNYTPDESSGLTKSIPGRDFIVSLGGFTNQVGTPAMQAGTFMHELGHALGLHHGGNDDTNYKPNYLSIMNYFFQLGGVQENGDSVYTYSTFQLNADEHHLSDVHALTSDVGRAGYGTNFYCPSTGSFGTILSIYGPVDWKCDNVANTEVQADVNADHQLTELPGRNDWATLQLASPSAATAAGVLSPSMMRQIELTPVIANGIKLFPVGSVTAKRKDRQIVVSWKAKPLGQVLSYIVSRRAGPDSKPVVIGRSGATSFVDVNPPNGLASYYISAAYAPFTYQGQPNAFFTGGPGKSQPFPNAITSKTALMLIQKSSPELATKFKSMGVTSPGAGQPERPFPSLLLQTDPSQAAVVQ